MQVDGLFTCSPQVIFPVPKGLIVSWIGFIGRSHRRCSVKKLFLKIFDVRAVARNTSSIRIDTSEVVVRRCSSKEVFLKILQYSQENACIVASFQ